MGLGLATAVAFMIAVRFQPIDWDSSQKLLSAALAVTVPIVLP